MGLKKLKIDIQEYLKRSSYVNGDTLNADGIIALVKKNVKKGKTQLLPGEAIVNMDAAAGDIAKRMLMRFQGPKCIDDDNNVKPEYEDFCDKLYNIIWKQMAESARVTFKG